MPAGQIAIGRQDRRFQHDLGVRQLGAERPGARTGRHFVRSDGKRGLPHVPLFVLDGYPQLVEARLHHPRRENHGETRQQRVVTGQVGLHVVAADPVMRPPHRDIVDEDLDAGDLGRGNGPPPQREEAADDVDGDTVANRRRIEEEPDRLHPRLGLPRACR